MGTRLIFLDQKDGDGFRKSYSSYWIELCGLGVPGNSPFIRPYPKPTQVVR